MKEEDKRSGAVIDAEQEKAAKRRRRAISKEDKEAGKKAKAVKAKKDIKTHTRLARRKKNARESNGKPIQSVVSKMHKCMYTWYISLRHETPFSQVALVSCSGSSHLIFTSLES